MSSKNRLFLQRKFEFHHKAQINVKDIHFTYWKPKIEGRVKISYPGWIRRQKKEDEETQLPDF